MPNNKWTKTATSASLAILGVTQLNNKADANIVQGGSNVTQYGAGSTSWTLDALAGYSAQAKLKISRASFPSMGMTLVSAAVARLSSGASFANSLASGAAVPGVLP